MTLTSAKSTAVPPSTRVCLARSNRSIHLGTERNLTRREYRKIRKYSYSFIDVILQRTVNQKTHLNFA